MAKKKAAKKVASQGTKRKVAGAKPKARAGKVSVRADKLEGSTLPSFSVESSSGNKVTNRDLKGKTIVLYFYPKDNTPGCTLEGHDFRRLYSKFQKRGVEIFGVSRDSIKSHQGFIEKCGFPFELLSDPDDQLMGKLDVIGMKQLYGRKFEGIIRSTFVVGTDGKIKRAWRNVKVNGHADEVLDFVTQLEG